jgi:Flp pilus assembly CpaF family ATPase
MKMEKSGQSSGSRLGRTSNKASPRTATLILRFVATIRGIEFDHDHPILETIFPLDGSRIEGIIAPIVPAAIMAIRLRPRDVFTPDDYTRREF